MTYFVLFLAAALFTVGDSYEAQCAQMTSKACFQDTQQWDSIRATSAEDCRLGCMEFAQKHGDEGCCEWDDKIRHCHYNFRASQSPYDPIGKVSTLCTTDAYHDRTQVDVVCADKYYMKGYANMPNREDCQKKCDDFGHNCHTFCHSNNNPEWDCLLYTACDEVQDQLHNNWADSYECYEKPGKAEATAMISNVADAETPHSMVVLHGLAAVGLAFVLFGSYKFYCSKQA